MRVWEEFVYGVFTNKKTLKDAVKESIKKLGLTIKQFSQIANITESNIYKITSGEIKDPQVSTIIKIVDCLKEYEQGTTANGKFIAVITERATLETIPQEITEEGEQIMIKNYAASDIEQGMIQGINAERDGATAIICGPITAYTLEKIVKIPVISLKIEETQLRDAIKKTLKKIS
jgi:predicted transcriptional regulator